MNKALVACLAFGVTLLAACQEKPKEAEVAEFVEEEMREVEAWSVKLVQRHHGPRDSDAILLDVSVLDKAGTRRLLAKDIVGPILLFEKERKVISCESQGSTMVGRGPILFDLNGRKENGPEHPGYLRECKQIEASNLVLLHYNLVREGKPYNLVRILDTDGKVVLEKELYRVGEVKVRRAEKMYRVQVPEPDWPG